MRKTHIMAAMLAALLSAACSNTDIHNGKTPIAKVYDTYLYYEDLGDIGAAGTSPIDSTLKVKQYAHVWAKQQIMIKVAELYLKDEEKDVQKQLEEYRNNLIIYRYKDRYINQNLDTVVTLKQSTEYYQNHPDDFILNHPAIKAIFVKVPQYSEGLQQIRKYLDFHSEKDSLMLIDLCKQHASRFTNFDNHWTSLQEASKDMPDIISEKNDALKANGTIILNSSTDVFMLKIRDHIPAGDIMPFDMAESSINRILINRRKTKLINDLEQSLLDDAANNNSIEYYEQK